MQKLLLFLCLSLGLHWATRAQQLRFGRAHGYNLMDIRYGNPDGPAMSSFTYVNCCWWDSVGISTYTKPLPARFSAWVVNPTNSIKHQVYLKVESYPSAVYSDTVSLNPGDSIKLQTAVFKTIRLYGSDFYLYEGVNLLAHDSLRINQDGSINDSRLSHYFGEADNFIGTPALGHDGGGFAVLYPIDPRVAITGFSIFTGGSNTISGGDVLIELYDSAQFIPSIGLGSYFLREELSINNATGWNTVSFYNQTHVSGSKVNYIWVVVRLFSNGGFNTIEVGNSQKVLPGDQCIWYLNTKGNNLWKNSTDTTEHIMNPLFHLNTFVSHWDPAPRDFSLGESTSNNFRVLPNPGSTSINLLLPPDWKKAEVKVYSLQGKLILEDRINADERLDVSKLSSGLFLLSAEENGTQLTTKLMIE
jgi:hypothetical protein